MTPDEIFMTRALALAQLADASVFPNPFVGAVIVHEGAIIAEGYHKKHGQAHAEVDAVNQVTDKSILQHCTIYVTLEPCAHHGLTPPCADLLVHHKFKRVVIGSVDPFALVNGAGVARLQAAGIEVEIGVLKAECDALNKRFFTFHQKKRPYITLKWAESKDGFIAPAEQTSGTRTRITGELAHLLVHQQRAQEHAILAGRLTIEKDNPHLNVRHIDAPSPKRFVLDANLKLGPSYHIFTDGGETHVLNCIKEATENQVHYHKLPQLTPATICAKLHELKILSVYIEGGATTLQHFIDAGLYDTVYRFVGGNKLGVGIEAPRFEGELVEIIKVDGDEMEVYKSH
jgi:diaminohydroxyphosphoribosylaminopyrimidine deaminase / 5-amino-6-(5-phosphoribosylamino)uracil reductase